MGDLFITPDQFAQLPLDHQVQLVQAQLGEDCEGVVIEPKPICMEKAVAFAPLVQNLSAPLQGSVLTGLTRNQRVTMFLLLTRQKSPEQVLEMVLSLPPGVAPELVLALPDPEVAQLMPVLERVSTPQAKTLVATLKRLMQSDYFSFLDEARRMSLPTLSNEALLIEMQAADFDATLAIEMTRRKMEANQKGNGLSFPPNKKNYAELTIEYYESRQSWTVRGVVVDKGEKTTFRYLVNPRSVGRGLWVDGRFVFSTAQQDRFFQDQVFYWARENSLDCLPFNPLPEDFGRPAFHRADESYAEQRLLKVAQGQSVMAAMIAQRYERKKANKPTWEYYFEGVGKNLLLVNWDHITDNVVFQVYYNYTEVPEKIPLDSKAARAFLTLLAPFEPNADTSDDAPALRALEQKLKALSEYR